MEAQTAQPPSDGSAAASYSRWVMLQQDLEIQAEGSSCSTSSGASETLAAARTSTGYRIQVSLHLAEPPGVSYVCLQVPDGLDAKYCRVVAAHGDSVLIEVAVPQHLTVDHFVYSAGAAAADPPRPPSMSLLPPARFGRPNGLVCRGEDVVVVADQLVIVSAAEPELPDTPDLVREADLCLFRSGEWSVRRLQIWFRDASEVPQELPVWIRGVPIGIGDRLLCWVADIWYVGVVLCNVFEETPRLQFVRLPMANFWGPPSNRKVCATASGDALKFINIFPRCCCGGAGACSCERSCHAYTIETWLMRIGNGDMEWVKDGIVDASELWALDSYKGLQCFPLDRPVVSMDEPELICFWLHEPEDVYKDHTVDVLMVNTRSKTILCVSRYEEGLSLLHSPNGLIPSNVSYFFDSYLGSGSDATFTGQRHDESIERLPPVIVDEQLLREDDYGSNRTKPALLPEPFCASIRDL